MVAARLHHLVWSSRPGDEIVRASALACAFDGIEAGEGRLVHELSPLGEIMDGPQIVLGRGEPDAAQSAGAESAAVEDEADLAQWPAGPGCR